MSRRSARRLFPRRDARLVRVSSLPVRFRVGLALDCVPLAFSSGGRGACWFLSALALCLGVRSSSVL